MKMASFHLFYQVSLEVPMEYPIHMPVFEPGHPLYLQLYQHLSLIHI